MHQDIVHNLTRVLNRCREHQITLNKKKFSFFLPEVNYVGFIVGRAGISADPGKLSAIKDFPAPTNLPTPLTSFIGREKEITQIKVQFRQSRLVTLTGSGGVGNARNTENSLVCESCDSSAGSQPKRLFWSLSNHDSLSQPRYWPMLMTEAFPGCGWGRPTVCPHPS